MSLNDIALLCVAIADLIIRLWEVRKGRRDENDDPNQSGT
jgi:hypothetical protein